MPYKVLFYCPDQHILYRADTPEKKGVGGGVTARIRLSQALADLGHDVTMISHVPRAHTSKGVTFLPLDASDKPRQVDVLVMTTSGDQLSLLPAQSLQVEARLREAWVHGTIPIKGLKEVDPDYVVAVSNFIRGVAYNDWGVPDGDVVVTCNGLSFFPRKKGFWKSTTERDPYSLIYFSHPSKGLDAAISVLKILRKKDERFTLHVYGGNALWGGENEPLDDTPGVKFHGMVGQKDIAQALRKTNISMHLQARLEPFALALVEAMGYGCVPVVSPVGGNREAVRHGYNGFWVEGDHMSHEVHNRAADLIDAFVQNPEFAAYIRRNAKNIPWSWENQAKVWSQRWAWELDRKGDVLHESISTCPECGGQWLLSADGYHCVGCGRYSLDVHQRP